MSERVQKQRPAPQEREAQTPHSAAGEQRDTSDIDALLDEIDGILEENATEVLKNYRQKGGQ